MACLDGGGGAHGNGCYGVQSVSGMTLVQGSTSVTLIGLHNWCKEWHLTKARLMRARP